MRVPVVALVGRPNVGKSTLFNRIVGRRQALVHPTPGVTRDRLYGEASWMGRRFAMVDTGGVGFDQDPDLGRLMREQAARAVAEAHVVVLVVDAREGLLPADREAAEFLRRAHKPVILVANKAETEATRQAALEFWGLGLGEPVPVSAEHGQGTADLLDRVVSALAPLDPVAAPQPVPEQEGGPQPEAGPEPEPLKVAVVGRPNVGKSSLINALIGQERVIVMPSPGTTRDAVDVLWRPGLGPGYLFTDTAGLRRPGKVVPGLERFSVARALGAVNRCQVAVLMVDPFLGVAEQERRIAGFILRAGRAALVLVSKWDLVPRDRAKREEWAGAVRARLPFLSFAPVGFCSSVTGEGLGALPQALERAAANHARRLSTGPLNRALERALAGAPLPTRRGRPFKVFYATQAAVRPPVICLFVNFPELVDEPYKRFLESRFRETFDFEGTPLVILPRARRRGEDLPSG